MPWRPLSLIILVVGLAKLGAVSAAADAADDPPSRIAFGSCADQNRPQPIWDAVVAAQPDLFLFIGDNIYADTEDMGLMKAKYDRLAAIPGYHRLRATCPILATWDDHDFGVNDGGRTYSRREDSQQQFLDFFGVPTDSPRRDRKGVYHAETFGPEGRRLQVILLDTRYHRSPLEVSEQPDAFFPRVRPYLPNTDSDATFLGEEQWAWLESQLLEPADVRIIVSSIQCVPEDHPFEKWMNIPRERDRLFALLRETEASGVVLISGDRHHAELSVMDAGIGYPLYDLTSSGLNQASKRYQPLEPNRHRLATMNRGDNFGLITIDWNRDDPLLRLQIRDDEGEVTIQQKVPLSLLQPGTLPTQ